MRGNIVSFSHCVAQDASPTTTEPKCQYIAQQEKKGMGCTYLTVAFVTATKELRDILVMAAEETLRHGINMMEENIGKV
ncbi:hypothetical protein KEM56_006020 [Ascosphaera pollenicola]|nr:hypothetical protein KEM56_006020 [Ascosphaera pollenicola]